MLLLQAVNNAMYTLDENKQQDDNTYHFFIKKWSNTTAKKGDIILLWKSI